MRKNMPPDALTGPYAQQQKILLYVLPVVFAVGGIAFPIGVLLYWSTSNLWTMGQQFYVIRNNPTPGYAGVRGEEDARRSAKHHEPRARRRSPATSGRAVDDPHEPPRDRPTQAAAARSSRSSQRKKKRYARTTAPVAPSPHPPSNAPVTSACSRVSPTSEEPSTAEPGRSRSPTPRTPTATSRRQRRRRRPRRGGRATRIPLLRGDRLKQLEAEGDIAADYLEELLDIADLDGDLDMDVEGDRAMVSIVGADLDAAGRAETARCWRRCRS